MFDSRQTLPEDREPGLPDEAIRRFCLMVVQGPKSGAMWTSTSDRCAIGFHPTNDLVIEDRTVSRFHCEIRVEGNDAHVRDLNSYNGTVLDGVRVTHAFLRSGSLIKLGNVRLRFELLSAPLHLPMSSRSCFGRLVGRSVAMRTLYTQLECAAAADITVLLQGETGTGKGVAAEAIHQMSARRDRPFLVIDCSAIPSNLIESELFGHEKGAFTGANRPREGAFEAASGGTIFLDEIGELTPDLQPKLLRALESKEFRRVGGTDVQKADVRVLAATNRDLRIEVNASRFRSDLYFRLAVLKVTIPPLRERPEDLQPIVETILRSLGANEQQWEALCTPELFGSLVRSAWPGNVRELRNYLERCLVFGKALPISTQSSRAQAAGPIVDASVAYSEARRRALELFELEYARALLRKHNGKVASAAAAAGIDRVYLYRILRRHGLKPDGTRDNDPEGSCEP